MKINRIYLNDSDTALHLSNLVVIVGPNGSGKTTFLRDLRTGFLLTKPNSIGSDDTMKWTRLVREDSFEVSSQEWLGWLASLIEVPGTSSAYDNTPNFATPNYLARRSKGLYVEGRAKDEVQLWLERTDLTEEQKVSGAGNDAIGQALRDQQTIYLSVDDRFYVSQNSTGAVQYNTMSDMNPVSFLLRHPEALTRINRVVGEMFKKSIRIETPTFPNYNLISVSKSTPSMPRLPQTPNGFLQQPKVYKEWFDSNKASSLADEGHGVRAAAEILYALELDTNKILFIDEPELHLYPNSKYMLGRAIAKYTRGRNKKQVILVTHDTDMLRGLLHDSREATLIRINKDRSITSTSSKKIHHTSHPDFLQGAFLDAAMLVEGIDDSYVYNRVFQHKKVLQDYAYNFVPCHGKDRIADNLTVYQNLNIPFAIIVDFDALYSDMRAGLIEHYMQVLNVPIDFMERINFQLDDVRQLIASKESKKRGLNMKGLTKSDSKLIKDLLNDLQKIGLFVVPIGELEDWVGVKKGQKSPSEIVAAYFSRSQSKYRALTAFVRDIENYLEKKIQA